MMTDLELVSLLASSLICGKSVQRSRVDEDSAMTEHHPALCRLRELWIMGEKIG